MITKLKDNLKGDKGFIQIIILIVIALVIIRVLGLSITDILDRPLIRELATHIKTMILAVWSDLKEIFGFFKSI